jgi:hypothetical protein
MGADQLKHLDMLDLKHTAVQQNPTRFILKNLAGYVPNVLVCLIIIR